MPIDDRPEPMVMCVDRVIAIVDDDAAVCDSTRVLLEAYDLDVRTYQSAADFLADERHIACLIVDYQMPGLNGLELVSELRRRGNTVPTIMITATTDPALERRAGELGIQNVLRKPLGSRVLLTALENEID
jgi:two-component system, LuxR family, response regulator FixJ